MTKTENDLLTKFMGEGVALPTDLENYYPTVAEIDESLRGASIEDLSPALIFFASDPYKGREEIRMREDYQETVAYAKELVKKIRFSKIESF